MNKKYIKIRTFSSPVSWQYIAGLFDGDGCVGYWLDNKTSNPVWRLIISQTESSKFVLLALNEFLDLRGIYSTVVPESKEARSMACEVIWDLRIGKDMDVIRFIKGILPFSIVRKEKLTECLFYLRKKNRVKAGISIL